MSLEVRELTPRGSGGVSVLRLRGAGARAALERLCPVPGDLRGAPRLARLAAASQTLDHALIVQRAPDEFELHVHGSPPVVAALMAELEGETSEPVCVEDQALELLAHAPGEAAARMLLDQAEGALRREVEGLLDAGPDAFERGMSSLLGRAEAARWLVRPPVVVLAGPVNAGKSTLFNCLLGRERVVESSDEGTTRDAIRDRALLGAFVVELVDTAGERALPLGADAMADVEREGQALAQALRGEADLICWLRPPGAASPHGLDGRSLVIDARGDLPGSAPDALRPREDPLGARRRVEDGFHQTLGLLREPWLDGLGVPFTPGLASALTGLAEAPPDARRALSGQVLGPPPVGVGPTRR